MYDVLKELQQVEKGSVSKIYRIDEQEAIRLYSGLELQHLCMLQRYDSRGNVLIMSVQCTL